MLDRTGPLIMAIKSDAHIKAESSVRQVEDDLEPFIVACVSTRMPMLFTDALDPKAKISFANDSFLSLTGYLLAEILGQSFFSLISEHNEQKTVSAVHKRFEKRTGFTYELKCCRKDRSEFWATVFVNPVFNREGKIIHHFASFIDLTKHKEEQEHSKMLIAELNHRVKNTLSTVQSIIRQALRANAAPHEIMEMLKSRISALSRSHDLLSRENWKGAGIRDILDQTLEPFSIIGKRTDRIKITGANIRCPPKAALALAIVFNELATNAIKYGSLSNDDGTVHIDWELGSSSNGKHLALIWQEFGGPKVKLPIHRGFGTRVIERGLTHELGGSSQIKFLPDGLLCKISIPMPKNRTGLADEKP